MVRDTHYNRSPEQVQQDEIKRLTDIVLQHEQRWKKLCAILQVNANDAPRVFQKLRLMMADMVTQEDPTPSDVIEARKSFPALNALHVKIDDAMLYEFERLNRHVEHLSGKDVTELAHHLAKDMVPKRSSYYDRFLLWWHNRFFKAI